jgi:uncharacterized SAM-binding protein YcdF (DUF218 family)
MLQPRKAATNKTRSLKWMSIHVGTIAGCFFIVGLVWMPWPVAFLFTLGNAIVHAFLDKVIWTTYRVARCPSENFIEQRKYAEDKWWYNAIAIDQTLHLVYLFSLFWALL